MWEDLFGKKKSKKQRSKEKMPKVRRKGKAGEDSFKARMEFLGNKVERTGRGSDFKVTKENWLGKKKTYYVEVKTGKSKLSKLQKETKKKKRNYKVVKEEPLLW